MNMHAPSPTQLRLSNRNLRLRSRGGARVYDSVLEAKASIVRHLLFYDNSVLVGSSRLAAG